VTEIKRETADQTEPSVTREESHRIISRYVLTSTGISSKPHELLTQADIQELNTNMEKLRETYVKIFEDQERIYKTTNPNYWKEEFYRAAMLITQGMEEMEKQTVASSSSSSSLSSSTPFTIAHNSQLYPFEDKNTILIGRYCGCDLYIDSVSCVSRLHVMIFPIPQINKYLVVDVGSLMGIKTLQRSTSNIKVDSLPNQRRVLIFDLDEVAELELGVVKICVNPRECGICFEKPRECTLNCGHYVVCNTCRPLISICPLCRANITDHTVGYRLTTRCGY